LIFKPAQIDKYLKKPDLGIKCFVVYGSNEGLIDEYVKGLIKTVAADIYDPFCTVYINEIDEGLIASEYNARSLTGGRRVVVIKDGTNDLTKMFKAILDGSKSDTLIIVSSTSFNKSSSLVKLAGDREDMAVIACYEDRDEDIYATVKAMLVENGFTIANEALQVLCTRLSNDRKTNLGELDKLITYMGESRNIATEDVLNVIGDSSASNTDDVCFYTALGEVVKSQKAFERLISEGTEPVSIVRALAMHFGRILQCKAGMEKGDTLEKAMGKLTPRVIFFREAGFKKQAMMWPKDRILNVLELLYKCERECKTTGMPVEEVASYCLLQIAGGAAKMAK